MPYCGTSRQPTNPTRSRSLSRRQLNSSKPRRFKRWMVLLPLSCALLTLPFFVGLLPGGEGTRTAPAATLTTTPTTTRSTIPTATPNATAIIRDATIRVSTLSAEYAALDATATREAVLDATPAPYEPGS